MTEPAEIPQEPRKFSLADLKYDLPTERIAQQPPVNRDDARLLVLNRGTGAAQDGRITDLPGLLEPGDLLVLNDTKVIPAKFTLFRETGGRVRGLFLEEQELGQWRVMLEGSRRLRLSERLVPNFDGAGDVSLHLLESLGEGQWSVRVEPLEPAGVVLSRIGQTPLPPYIKRAKVDAAADQADRSRYQTVYAKNAGAVAAPTAGLHFTDALLQSVRGRGVDTAFVTLHVGLGTFRPIEAATIEAHVMHHERFEISEPTAVAVNTCKSRGGRIVAVGTTCVRVLETAVRRAADGELTAATGETDLFIYPPYAFGIVDALMTNFHLPESTLLAMVMAFGGIERVRRAYQHAIDEAYRFFSYGDAMLIY